MNLYFRIIYRKIRYLWRFIICLFRRSLNKVYVDPTSWVSMRATIRGNSNAIVRIGHNCEIHPYSMILSCGGNIEIGDRVSLNPFSIIYGHGGIKIGSDVRIAASVTIIPGNHVIGTDIMPLSKSGVIGRGIVIENNVWIGSGVRILDGVTIGKNAVIGAGSVVTKDVLANSVVAGVPAIKIK